MRLCLHAGTLTNLVGGEYDDLFSELWLRERQATSKVTFMGHAVGTRSRDTQGHRHRSGVNSFFLFQPQGAKILFICFILNNVLPPAKGSIVIYLKKTLTFARTCYFPHPRTHMGGGATPHAISPLIEIELWDKDQTNPWDVLSRMVSELTSLGHILTPPGRAKEKKRVRFEDLPFFANNFRTKKDSGIIQAPSCFSL